MSDPGEHSVRIWRCTKCAKWSHAKKEPKKHQRHVGDGEFTDCGPFEAWIATAPASGGNRGEQVSDIDIRTAAGAIHDAAWRVNWRPDLKHSEQARYDALQALTSFYAFYTAVAMETLRRVDAAAADRVAAYVGDDDQDWALHCENAWAWHGRLSQGEPIDPDGQVFPALTGSGGDVS